MCEGFGEEFAIFYLHIICTVQCGFTCHQKKKKKKKSSVLNMLKLAGFAYICFGHNKSMFFKIGS